MEILLNSLIVFFSLAATIAAWFGKPMDNRRRGVLRKVKNVGWWVFSFLVLSLAATIWLAIINKNERDAFTRKTQFLGDTLSTVRTTLDNFGISLSKDNKEIILKGDQILRYVKGDIFSVPAITSTSGRNSIGFWIINKDSIPMLNVKAKCNEMRLPDIGTLPTKVVTRFYDAQVHANDDHPHFNFIIWYNNTNIYAEVEFKRDPNGFLRESKISYADAKGNTFVHPWQGRGSTETDTAKMTYKPNLFN